MTKKAKMSKYPMCGILCPKNISFCIKQKQRKNKKRAEEQEQPELSPSFWQFNWINIFLIILLSMEVKLLTLHFGRRNKKQNYAFNIQQIYKTNKQTPIQSLCLIKPQTNKRILIVRKSLLFHRIVSGFNLRNNIWCLGVTCLISRGPIYTSHKNSIG